MQLVNDLSFQPRRRGAGLMLSVEMNNREEYSLKIRKLFTQVRSQGRRTIFS